MYRRKLHSSSELRYLVNRTAIHVPRYYHKITEYEIKCCMHACTSRGATCTVKQGRIADTNLYFWTIFQFFFIIQMGPGPTHPLPNYFWIFGIFLTLQSPLIANNKSVYKNWTTCMRFELRSLRSESSMSLNHGS